ncbi:MAG: DUF1499 domain-containing protein [Pseudomonadota bacterium]
MKRTLAVAAAALLVGCAGTPAAQEPVMIDFSTLEVPSSPNTWVIAPEGYLTTAEADVTAPVFDQAPSEVFAALVKIVEDTPRRSAIDADTETLHLSYVARVAFTLFLDDVDIAVLETEDGGSTLVAYSRSRVGYSDFGVNERRLTELMGKLKTALAAS